MSIFNLENAKWLIATLTLPAVLAFAANRYQQSQAERQINEARLRLYTELLFDYDSVREKLLTLPDDLEVYPGHFLGSGCGVGMSGKPSSTIAFEKRWNRMLSLPRDKFIEAIIDVPAKPSEHERILAFNQGRA